MSPPELQQKVETAAPSKVLTVFDSTCIMVGIIIGAGIYETAPVIAANLPDNLSVLGIWALGGLLSFAGAVCYAELAVAYPRDGGDYIYLNRAYGDWAGYLFAWGRLIIIQPGSIAAVAFIFARYLHEIWEPPAGTTFVLTASVAIAFLTALNLLNVGAGKWTQNILTVAKVLGLMLICAAALSFDNPPASGQAAVNVSKEGIGLALILVLFCYGGWNEIAYVAAEVHEPKKNIYRSLIFSVSIVTILYLLLNYVFLDVLGHSNVASSSAVASDLINLAVPWLGGAFISILICVSALGVINGLIFTGARISYAVGLEYPLLSSLGLWSAKKGTPYTAFILQGVLSILIVLITGTFTNAVVYTTAVVWLFFLATGISVFVLRKKDANIPRPYKALGHPFTTILFCLSCVYVTWSALLYDPTGSAVALAVMVAGLPIYWYSKHRGDAEKRLHR